MVPVVLPGLEVSGLVPHAIWTSCGSSPLLATPSDAEGSRPISTVTVWPLASCFSASVRLSRTSKSTSTSSVDLSG